MKLNKQLLVKLFILLLPMNVYRMNMCRSNVSPKYVIAHWGGGMGICLTSALNHLLHCEEKNLTPVMFWHKSLYWNEDGFNDIAINEWKYYFEPISNLKYSPGDVINSFCPSGGYFFYYDTPQEKRDLANRLINKYIRPNTIVRSKIEQFYTRYMQGRKTIGIHIRGTDKHIEEKPVAITKIIAEALKYADRDTQFFIATDEQRILDTVFKLLEGKKVINYNCYRSEDGKPLHYRSKPSAGQLGEDVIVEMWLMAKCDLLIHTFSNVSSIPLYINPNLMEIVLREL